MKKRQDAEEPRPGVSAPGGEGRVVFVLEDRGFRSVCAAGDFNSWSPDADPMERRRDGTWRLEKRGLISGQYRYKYVLDGGRWITDPGNPRVEADASGWTNSVLTIARSAADGRFIAAAEAALAKHPPRWDRHAGRGAALGALDEVLLREGASGRPAVQELFRRRLARLVERLRRDRVRNGWRTWLVYNHGFIVETPAAVIGFDVVSARGGPNVWWNIPAELVEGLASCLDILLVSHRHLDHLDVELVARMRGAGKAVVLPVELSCLFARGVRHASPGDALDLPGGVRVRAHDGRHVYAGGRVLPMRYYEAEFPGGPRVLHLADHDYTGEVPHDGPVDLLIPKCGGVSADADDGEAMRRCLAAVRPARVLPGHLFELGHPVREGRTGIAAAHDILEGAGVPFEALFWGEGIGG
jgi:L-ascorbate metabolism protein UlaG (beta-lactamase superfamily)